jgi:hypothetical protein
MDDIGELVDLHTDVVTRLLIVFRPLIKQSKEVSFVTNKDLPLQCP